MSSTKAQTAIEYFIIVSLALMIIIPYIIYSNQMLINYRDENNLALARAAVNKIGQSVDWVFSQGPPAKISTQIFIPDGIVSIQFLNKTINFKVKTSSGISDVFYITITNVTGYLPTVSGYYNVYIYALDDRVNITV